MWEYNEELKKEGQMGGARGVREGYYTVRSGLPYSLFSGQCLE